MHVYCVNKVLRKVVWNAVTVSDVQRAVYVRREKHPKHKSKITLERNTIDFESSIIDFT